MTEREKYKLLVSRYLQNKATAEELEVFFHLTDEGKLDAVLEEVMAENFNDEPATIKIIPFFRQGWFRIAAAASLIIIISVSYLIINWTGRVPGKTDNTTIAINNIVPGGNKALLTLSDGSTIVLDSAQNGTLSQQGNTKISKLRNGEVAYNVLDEKPTGIFYNTIATPRGGQYQLTLADGSKVWLNAASSLRFSTTFAGKERKVELTGEAYFEVTKNTAMPFKVSANGTEVEVLGTHFNINAYADEAFIKTTLLEGAVKVSKGNATQKLTAGQQAQVNANGQISLNKAIDLDEVMAWKNGKFIFTGNNIRSVMRQLEKWYDISIEYKGAESTDEFVGVISRNVSIYQILKIMEKTNSVNFEIKDRKIIVK